MAVNTWSSAGSTDGNLVGNWSLGALAATDVLTLDATSVIDCTFSGNITCAGLSMAVGYTGTFGMNTRTFDCTGNWTFGSAATISAGASLINLNGTAAQTFTSNSKSAYDITINRATAGTCLFADATSLHTLTASATNTQVISWTGTTMTASGDITLDGTGTHVFGTAVTLNGASSNFHIGSTLTAPSAASCAVTFNGTTGCVMDDDKGATFKSLTLGANAVVTNNGTGTPSFSGPQPVTFTAGGTLTLTNRISLGLTASGDIIKILAGTPTLVNNSSANANYWSCVANNVAMTFPAMTWTGSTSAEISFRTNAFTGCSIALTGNVSFAGNFGIIINAATGTESFSTGDFSITCNSFLLGGAAAVGTATRNINFGSSAITCGSFVGNIYTGYANINLQTSQWTCTGAWTFGINHTITGTAATQSITITNTSTITSNGKIFPGALILNGAGKTFTLADGINIQNTFTLTAGTFTTATFTVIVIGNVVINTLTTFTISGSTCTFSGNYTTGPASTVTTNAATNYTFMNAAVVSTFGVALPQVTFQNNFSITGTCTIARLVRGIDGFTGTFEAGSTFTITNLAAASWNGAAGALNAVRSSIPGTRFTLVIPNAVTLTYYDSQDCIYQGFNVTANDGTSITRGNNARYLTFNVVTETPTNGSELGGTVMTFTDTGNGFGGICTVTVGGVAATGVTVVDTQHLTAVTPAGTVGPAVIVVTNGDGDTRTLAAVFTYEEGHPASGVSRCYVSASIGI